MAEAVIIFLILFIPTVALGVLVGLLNLVAKAEQKRQRRERRRAN